MTRFRTMILAGAALVVAGFTTQVYAQTPPPADHGRAAGARHGDPARWQEMKAKMQARRAAREQDLATILRLRPDQQGAFQAFTASMHPSGDRHMKRDHDRAAWETMTTPQRLDAMATRMNAHMAERQQRMTQRIQATKAFYAALSPEQQKVFDALGREHGGMGGGHHHRGGHMGHHGWGHGGMDHGMGDHPMGPAPKG